MQKYEYLIKYIMTEQSTCAYIIHVEDEEAHKRSRIDEHVQQRREGKTGKGSGGGETSLGVGGKVLAKVTVKTNFKSSIYL
ncbi:hypothetical protein ECG_04391 [Echinococcus granulosus]|uniref:Expressed protein n=1 Tax=Echinococcus granulosus TaxID=6210 RepID=A0A068WI96_ECHGR|nr:hypothetical protein ECG_04391 [Echinococcus granulosus]CDS17326.1 expressed protein [Echinococcus granulosus]